MGCDGKENVSGGSFEDVTGRGVGRRSEKRGVAWRGDGVWGRSNPGAGAGSGESEV